MRSETIFTEADARFGSIAAQQYEQWRAGWLLVGLGRHHYAAGFALLWNNTKLPAMGG